MDQIVIARCSSEKLLAVMGRLTAPFAALPPGRETVNLRVDGIPVVAGEIDGLAYLLENEATVFAYCWGLLERVAREVDALVLGAGFEADEEHGELFAANGQGMMRAWWRNPFRTTEPYSLGAPLPSEAAVPLSAPAGRGLSAALREFGFPAGDFGQQLPEIQGERLMLWKGEPGALYETDDHRKPVNAHVRKFGNPAYRPPQAVVRVRRIEN